MEYDVAPEDRERSINCSQQKFYNAFQQHQHNSVLLGQNMKTATTPTNITEITAFQPIQYATNSSSKVTTTTTTLTNHSMSAAATAASEQKYNSSIIMEAATSHISLIDDEEEKDPLALDSTLEQQSQLQDHLTVKHTHSLRRHVPRIIVKPIPPEKKTATTATATTAAAVMTTTTITSHSSISPSSRTSSSRRIQQQQQAKAAAAAAAAAAANLATSNSLPTATTFSTTAITQASTMREVLASIPGFSLKPRRRSSKKISTAAQIEQTKDGKIDLETPDSILASTNLRALLNKQTFSMLPPLYQYNLIQLLPSVDREAIEMERKQTNATAMPIEAIRLGTSNLNNEFFARACLEWRERLSEGEFTPENQVKLKTEAEREKNKLDPWKLKHFEPIWGEKAANRACSSNSSISSNKSSIDTCNIAITNSSSSGSGSGSGSVSGSGSGSCKSLGEQKLEFKLESKGALTATIVNATSNALNIKESPSLEQKPETKSIIECRLDQHQKATEVLDVTRPITFTKQEADNIENSVSGKEYICKEEKISTHLQQRNNDELKCDKQTEMYENIEAVDQGCFVNSEGIETHIKREPPSVFDLLRMQGNLYEHEAKQQKRGTKRSSDSISASALVSAGNVIESDNNSQQQQDGEPSDSYNMESKQLKIEITNQNVPKQSKSNFVTCAVSSDAPITTTTTNFQKISSSTTELEVAEEEVVEEETSSCNASAPLQNTTFTQEILDSYAAVEQQLHLHFLQKQEHLKATTQQITTESELELAATPTTKLQYFAQIQPTTNTNQNIINNINSTCDSMKDAFNAVEKIAAASSNQTIELQQIVAAVNESPRDGDAVDLIEQNFADAENYVLQSGDASTDSGDTLNVQNSTAISAAPTGNKNNLNEGDFIFSSSLDHVIGSDDCDNLYDNNKAMLPTSISSATTSSSSSSSSSSTSSSPTTSSAVTTSDMQEIISAANSLSNTLFQAPQQLQQQQQQQQQHQPQRKLQEEQQQPTHGCNIMSSSASTTSRHNEMFQHVQHDWNFGGLKLHQTNEKYLNTSQDQSTATQQPHQHQHILQSAIEVQEDDEINDDNEDEVDECVLSHTISNDVTQHIIEDEPEDDDEMDDSDAVRDIVDELQQQHQQLLQEQQQEHLHQQLQVQEQQRQEQQQQFPTEQLEYSNEMSESLSSDVLCEVPMSAAEMEVTSTVVTNSNSNDDSSNELNLFNSNTASISNPAINHIQHMPPQPPAQTQQQRQILVDSNGQIIRNFLMQQQQLQQQQQLLQHAQQLAAFQTNQHHQASVTIPQAPQQQQQTQQQLIQHTQPHPQQQQHQHQPQKTATLSMQVIRRQYDSGTNGQQQLFQHAVSAQPQQQQQHPLEQSNQHQIQHFALQQQQQRNFLPQTTNAVSQQASTSNNLMPSQQIQLQTAQHQQQHHHQQQQQQQQHHQHQQMPTFQTHVQQQPKFISKQLNIISMPRSSVNITSSSAATPSAATAYSYNTSPAISAALPTAATAAANNLITAQHQQQQQHVASTAMNSIKTLPSTPVGIPSTIAQQRLIMTKLPSGKGRKATNNKLPPGAVNLERSYQICQAVIQNSPNRESLKAQLRPPSAILGQQQSSGGSSPSSTSLSNSCSSASSSPSSSAVHIKNEEIIASSTTLPTGMPPNVMGVGRPNVYKVIGPRMGFPRKKYVQRQPSPTMIRHVYAAPPGTVNMSAANSQQLNVLQQQQQQHHPHHHPHIQLQAPPPQHELHQNGSGQYVLVHRANVGAADNQAPRASSAPPVPQNQHQFHGMNGIPITGRGRPASVDVDTSNTVHEIQQTIHGANPANIVRRNISAGNITYIDNYSATAPAALVDGSNYIVATASAAQSTDNSGENTPPTTDTNNCACSLNAMVICQQCGAFCHDDCVSATKLCVSCVIR